MLRAASGWGRQGEPLRRIDEHEPRKATSWSEGAPGAVIAAWRRRLRLSSLSIKGEERLHAFLFLLPTLLLLAVLLAVPLAYSAALTFTGKPVGPGQLGEWVGFDHWSRVWPAVSAGFPFLDSGDRVFNRAFVQTIQYIIPSVIGATVFGLFVALVLNQEFPGRAIVRASLLIPWAIPPVVVAAMFQWFLDSRRGLFGFWLEKLGIVGELDRLGFGVTAEGKLLFFDDRWLPAWFDLLTGLMTTFIGIHIWKTFPLMAIIFLVALQYLPKELLQAARLDGANFLRRLRYIILPHLWPALVAAMIVQFLLTITMFDVIFALGSGGVKESTLNIYVYAYRQSFFLGNLGYGAVLAYVVSGILILFALALTRGRIRAPL